MRIFKHRSFHQWARSEGISDLTLKKAIDEMNDGLFEATLGSGLFKKRVALPGKGKRGSYRTLVAFRSDKLSFFVYGFSKNERSDVSDKEKKLYRQLAKEFLNLNKKEIMSLVENGKLFEVK